MNGKALIVAAVVIIGGAIIYTRQAQAQAAQDAADTTTSQDDGGIFAGVQNMIQSSYSNLTASAVDSLNDANVQAFLQLIRTGEGTKGDIGYRTIFGGQKFSSFADHPRVFVPFGATTSSAAGAYQILGRTWDEMASKYDLQDFSPANQDIAAIGLIKRRGALGDVLAGRFKSAIEKCNKEWASLPLSPYGQPTLTMSKAAVILAANGVQSSEVMA